MSKPNDGYVALNDSRDQRGTQVFLGVDSVPLQSPSPRKPCPNAFFRIGILGLQKFDFSNSVSLLFPVLSGERSGNLLEKV
jgi:hypothetical protein